MAEYKTYSYKPKSTDFRDYMTRKQPTSTYTPTEYSDSDGAYASDIARAQAALNQTLAGKPAAYQSQYADQINGVMGQMSGRKFDYDVNADAMFQQLKAIYAEQGKQAMADTQGQAAALTGGYGNSYGVAASQQAYQQSQEQLYDRIPELYQLALSRYQQEGEDLANLYSMYAAQDATDYGRHRDSMTDWENERAYREAALRNLQGMNQSLWAQNESNAYNANNQAWNNYWTAEQQTAANRAQAVSEDQFNSEMAYKYAALEQSQRQYEQSQKDKTPETTSNYDSVFSLSTGKQRFENTGTLFTEKQYNGFRQQVGMNRGNEGRIELVYDALCEGKITEKQAEDTLRHYGISDDEFTRVANKQWNDAVLMARKRNK